MFPMIIRMDHMSGDDLRQMREARGLSQDELGKLLNISARQVRNWEDEDELPAKRAARAMAVLGEQTPTRLAEMDNVRLIGELLSIIGELAERLAETTPKGVVEQTAGEQPIADVTSEDGAGGTPPTAIRGGVRPPRRQNPTE